ncbi:hypothetical protein FOA52_001952, partial [Chlamydomonas sp. UWO 241]
VEPRVVMRPGSDDVAIEAPAVCVLHVRRDLPESEAQLTSRVPVDDPSHECFHTRLCVRPDGTVAVEVSLCHSLIQWPYLSDMSLISAMVALFVPGWCLEPAPLIDTIVTKASPWLYFNLVASHSQLWKSR